MKTSLWLTIVGMALALGAAPACGDDGDDAGDAGTDTDADTDTDTDADGGTGDELATEFSECIEICTEALSWVYDSGTEGLAVTWECFELNCCIDAVAATGEIVTEGETDFIRIRAEEVCPEPCDCVCNFDVLIAYPDVPPGAYTLELYYYETLRLTEDVVLE
jgi:hypothetical protein